MSLKNEEASVPIRVCYAMTINKSQGQSLEKVESYLQKPVCTFAIWGRMFDRSSNQGVTNVFYKEIFNNPIFEIRGIQSQNINIIF